MRWNSHIIRLGFTLAVVSLLALPALAASPVADVLLGGGQVEWVPASEFAGLKLTVSGPEGVSELAFGPGENPRFDLAALTGDVDGIYTWELTARPLLDQATTRALAEARVKGEDGNRTRPSSLPPRESLIQTGSFRVIGGAIVQPAEEGATDGARRIVAEANRVTAADQVIPDDLIVQSSLCVGFDCVNNENFGFDTIRLKENNLRINFADTSAGSFPSNDWRLVANDSASGGRNVFYLEDSNTGREVVSVEAGAPSNALWVDSTGNIGAGTSTPVLQLHIKDGNTPGIRLEQDNSSGFTAQTWDVAGNEANFFVRDVTGGSLLPFRVRPGAPTSSVDIAADGSVGIGTASPSGLQVNRALSETADGTDNVRIGVLDGTPRILFENEGFQQWQIDNFAGDFRWFTPGVVRMVIEDDGDVGFGGLSTVAAGNAIQHSNGAALTTAGVWADASSREYKEEIEELSTEEAMSAFRALVPVSFRYKRNPEEQYVGFIAEDVPDLVAMSGRKNLAAIEVVALLTKVVQEQERAITELREELAAQRAPTPSD